ncbi:hypothetical protein ABKN59_011515 [Abortiporus biennis]
MGTPLLPPSNSGWSDTVSMDLSRSAIDLNEEDSDNSVIRCGGDSAILDKSLMKTHCHCDTLVGTLAKERTRMSLLEERLSMLAEENVRLKKAFMRKDKKINSDSSSMDISIVASGDSPISESISKSTKLRSMKSTSESLSSLPSIPEKLVELPPVSRDLNYENITLQAEVIRLKKYAEDLENLEDGGGEAEGDDGNFTIGDDDEMLEDVDMQVETSV